MKQARIGETEKFVSDMIAEFHKSKIKCLEQLDLNKILKSKNPYLFKAKNFGVASELVKDILDAYLYSSEEKLFGDFLEELAIFVCSKTYGGEKSPATGIDLQFDKDGIKYLVSVKSGTNWGNSSQHKRQEQDFQTAVKVLSQSKQTAKVQPILGICYGKTKTTYVRNYMKVVGQNFWHFLSGNEDLYTDIVEPLGYRAKELNDDFLKQKAKVVNLFTEEFMKDFCVGGEIDWKKLVRFNSGNLGMGAAI